MRKGLYLMNDKLPLFCNPKTLEDIITQRRLKRAQQRKESKERTRVFLEKLKEM